MARARNYNSKEEENAQASRPRVLMRRERLSVRQIDYAVVQGDATMYDADVLILKFAQGFYGVDRRVSELLCQRGHTEDRMRPAPGDTAYLDAAQAIRARHVLFLGTPRLRDFGYTQIRRFARRALTAIGRAAPNAVEIAMTLHGTGYGLDEVESCLSEFDGCLDALLSKEVLTSLKGLRRITIVERDSKRVSRLSEALTKHVVATGMRVRADQRGQGILQLHVPDAEGPSVPSADSTQTQERQHAFVAMPFSLEMMDVFYFGIQNPIREAGLICERLDHDTFLGDIVQWMRERIASASVVVADLTGANPNVYLEVGYAWAKGRPVVLVARGAEEVAFDVRGHKRIMYNSIHELEQKLGAELTALRTAGHI